MHEVKHEGLISAILYRVVVLVIVVECGDVGTAASGIDDVAANSPNMPRLLL